ncbi:MAG: hypothetical protein ACE5GX_18945 [Thermoanaerobaculia bacterium]
MVEENQGLGFEFYLRQAARARSAEAPGQLKLLLMIGESDEGMPILDLAAKARLELFAFMETIRDMQESGLVELDGSTADAENIRVKITKKGLNLASLRHEAL